MPTTSERDARDTTTPDPLVAPPTLPGDDTPREDARDLGLRRSDADGREQHRRHAPLKLGFLTFVSPEGGSPHEALRNGLRLFAEAEQLGFDLGLVRVRHFQPYLSGPVSFLSAASQRTSVLRIGTGVIPFHAEDPIRLAEELLTLDALSDGRAEIGIAATTEATPGVRSEWRERDNSKRAVWQRIERFLELVAGAHLDVDDGTELPGVPRGSSITVTPPSPGLRDRIWNGPGSLASVELTAEHRLKLQISTLSTEDVGLRFEPQQFAQIARYRERFAHLHPGARSEVSVSRNVFPLTGGRDDDALTRIGRFFTDRLYDDGAHRINGAAGFRYSHPAFGRVDDVIEYLRTDVALAAADNLVFLVPSELDHDAQVRLLRTVSEHVAPALR